jgi:chitinase
MKQNPSPSPHGTLLRSLLFSTMVLFTLVVVTSGTALAQSAESSQSKILAGYFEEWSIYGANYNIANLQQNHVASKITHLIYAFANVAPTSGAPNALCQLADPWADYQTPYLPSVSGQPYTNWPYGNFGALIQLKQLHPNLKIMISLGGASAANAAGFSYAASTPALRSQLVASCLDMFITGNVGTDWNGNPVSIAGLIDGLDIDWEFPSATDKRNFSLLMREFRNQLDALGAATNTHYLLSIFAPAGAGNYSNIELSKVASHLDFLNVQGYDMHGTWESSTNHASPLFDSPKDPSFGQGFDVDDTIAAYMAAGVSPRKLLVGVPFYGRGWTGVPDVNHGLYQPSTGPAPSPTGDVLQTDGIATYGTLQSLTGFTHYFDPISLAQWIYNPDTQTFWTYDNQKTANLKTAYVQSRVPGGLGGAFFWAFKDDDANGTLAKTLATGLGR